MKKFLSVLIAAMMLLSPVNVYAVDSQPASIPITYEVDGSFMMSIPSSVTVGESFTISACEFNLTSDKYLQVNLDSLGTDSYLKLYNDDDISSGKSESEASTVSVALYADGSQITTSNMTLGYLYSTSDSIVMSTEYVMSSDGKAGQYTGVISFCVNCVG